MTRSRLLGALAGALTLVAALGAAPSPALAAEGQVDVSVPTTVPCVVKHDGTVIAPSNWEMKNVGSEEVSLGKVSVTSSDEAISLSASSSVAGGNKSAWFSYQNGSYAQAKTGETLAPGASVSVDWSVGKLDATTNASTLEAAANGTFTLARVDFTFGQKQAFAVWYSDNTAGLYKRFEAPAVGDTFDGKTVTKVVTGIENMTNLFNGSDRLTSVTAVDEGISPETMEGWFKGCKNLTTANLAKLDTSRTTSMRITFYGCSSLATLDVSKWDVSKVTNMLGTFYSCSSLATLDVSKWNVSSVTNMYGTFYGCSSLAELDVSEWHVSSVTDMSNMFYGCSTLAKLDVTNWNVSSVTSMASTFYGCSSLATLDVSNWDVSSVTNMHSTFRACSKLAALEVSNWDVSKVTDMRAMFETCSKLTTLNVSDWNVSSVTSMSGMFENCSKLTVLNVSNWNVSSVTSMSRTFYGCSSLTSLDLSNWSSAKVTNVGEMFYGCYSLRSLALGAQWTKSLTSTSLPSTLYGANGTPYALADVPLGVAGTYYTKAEYVPQGNPTNEGVTAAVPATPEAPDTNRGTTPETPAAGQGTTPDAGDEAGHEPGASTNAAGVEPDGSVPNATTGSNATSASTGDATDATALAA